MTNKIKEFKNASIGNEIIINAIAGILMGFGIKYMKLGFDVYRGKDQK